MSRALPPHPPYDEVEDDDATELLTGTMEGAFFADRYRIDGTLGSGSMGEVFRAVHLPTGEAVALKVLHPDKAHKEQVVSRFHREAEILTRLGHPGIVRIRESGLAPGNVPYLVMELLEGRTLRALFREERPMAPERVLEWLVPLTDALEAAHAEGIVHRDLKPDNIMLLASGDPPLKVLDFGLSLLESMTRLTKTGVILGTPRYMAPEQIRSIKDTNERTDIYAVGVLVHEALSGRSPFPAEDAAQLLGCVLEGRVRPLEEERPDLPAELARVLRRAMAKEPKERFQTIGAFAEAFAGAIGRTTGRSRLVDSDLNRVPELGDDGAEPLDPNRFDPGGPPRPGPPRFTAPPLGARHPKKSRRGLRLTLFFLALLGVAFGCAGLALGARGCQRLMADRAAAIR